VLRERPWLHLLCRHVSPDLAYARCGGLHIDRPPCTRAPSSQTLELFGIRDDPAVVVKLGDAFDRRVVWSDPLTPQTHDARGMRQMQNSEHGPNHLEGCCWLLCAEHGRLWGWGWQGVPSPALLRPSHGQPRIDSTCMHVSLMLGGGADR
jgi:hypothetical protein